MSGSWLERASSFSALGVAHPPSLKFKVTPVWFPIEPVPSKDATDSESGDELIAAKDRKDRKKTQK